MAPSLCEDTYPKPTPAFLEASAAPVQSRARPEQAGGLALHLQARPRPALGHPQNGDSRAFNQMRLTPPFRFSRSPAMGAAPTGGEEPRALARLSARPLCLFLSERPNSSSRCVEMWMWRRGGNPPRPRTRTRLARTGARVYVHRAV